MKFSLQSSTPPHSSRQHFLPLLFLSLIFLLHIPTALAHTCIHDKIHKQSQQPLIYINDSEHQMTKRRFLQTNSYGPIRIHYQYNTTTINDNDVVGRNIKKIMSIIDQFWSKTIEIDYQSALSFSIPASSNSNNYSCLTFRVPSTLITTPTPNKDFGLLIQAEDDGASGVTAYSYPCASSSVTKRTLWGFIHWNKNYLLFNPLSFQENVHIGIHQILHVLGFSQILYQDFKNSQIFITQNGQSYLNGTYIQSELARQYNCTTSPGMSLQLNGGSGTALSHWSRKTALNELMTAGVSTNNPTISYITLALLEETGWYRKIYKGLGRFVNFGYQKGCGMITGNDCTSNQYCNVVNEIGPNYDRTALGYCKNDSLSLCLFVKFYDNFICIDPNYAEKSLHAQNGIINITGERGGMNSRIFVSDLRISGQPVTKYSFRCYQTICSPSRRGLTLRVGSILAHCAFPNQLITIKGYDGNLRCPSSFQEACAVVRCPNQCSANGICANNRCLCDPNFTGSDCSQLTTLGFASKTPLFLPQQNGNCVAGSYRSEFGDCELCDNKCERCNINGCVSCTGDVLPINGKC